MRGLLWKLFPPYEVKLTIEAIQAFLSDNAGFCRSLVEPAALALAKDAEKTVYSVRIEHMKPDHLALLIITNVLGAYICSGQYHTYRATLSIIGKDMLKVWHAAQGSMLKLGYASEAEVAEDNEWIQKQVKLAG